MNTTTASAAVISTPESRPAKLQFTLLDGSVVELPVGNWDVDILLEGTFRRNFFKATDGRYYPVHQIKFVVEGVKNG